MIFVPSVFSWWNSSWRYRRAIMINSDINFTDYPLNFIIDTRSFIHENKLNNDCSDIRIIEGKNVRKFSVIDCNSTNTLITFRANSTSSDVYIYYGNINATQTNSSFYEIYYELYDDFTNRDGSLPDTSKWVVDCRKGTSTPINWNCSQVFCKIYSNTLMCFSKNDIRSGVYSIKNFSYYDGWIVEFDMYRDGTNVYQHAEFRNKTDVLVAQDWIPQILSGIKANGNMYYVTSLSFAKFLNNGTRINFAPYDISNGWHNFRIILNKTHVKAYYDNELKGITDYSNFGPSDFKLLLWGSINTQQGGQVFFDNIKVRKYVEPEPSVILGPEETFQQLFLPITTESYTFTTQPFTVLTNVKYNNSFVTTLTQDNFLLTLENNPLSIQRFKNYGNGTYELVTTISSHNLGKKILTIRVDYRNITVQNSTKVLLLTKPKKRVLIITNPEWKNYIPAVTTNKPTLVYNQTRKFIDYFISYYNPQQIFQLGTNLTFQQENYNVDSGDTLVALFFNKTDIVVPKNKEVAITSATLGLPVIYEPSKEVLEYIDPRTVYEFEKVEEVEDLFLRKNPDLKHIILVNPNDEKSMFAASLARKAFVIQSKLDSEKTKNLLKQKITKLNFQTKDYSFNLTVFLTLVGVPYFNLTDPVKEVWNDYDGDRLLTDTPYADINDDGYLDLAIGRLEGSVEEISYQLELSKILKPRKTALILAAYNTPGKYFDVMTAGGTMQDVINIELTLYLKGFKITRLVERRSEFDILNISFIEKLGKLAKEFNTLGETSYASFLSLFINGLRQIIVVLRAGETILYAMNEFDWIDAWQSIVKLEPHYPKHLPELTVSSMVAHLKNNSVIIYMSKGNETHWFIPTKKNPDLKLCTLFNYEEFCTNYTVFDPAELNFSSSFYYVHHSKGFYNYRKLFEKGTLALIGSTGATHNLYSARTAHKLFSNFDKPIGKSLAIAKNWNYEINEFLRKQKTKIKLEEPNVYLKEYYTKNLLGNPSLLFDPNFKLKESQDIQVQQGRMKITFKIKPNYSLVEENGKRILYFERPDDFLLAYNKPIVPLYKRSFLLPSNTEILDVNIRTKTKSYKNLTLSVLLPDPEFYQVVKSFEGDFPADFYWNGSFRLLDNRLVYDFLFSPVIYSSNNSALVFEEIEVSFYYKAPIEILSLSSRDVAMGETTRMVVDVYNSYPNSIEASYLAKIDSKNFTKLLENKIILNPGKNSFHLDFKPEKVANYSISIVLRYDNLIAGPKYTWFSVLQRKKKPLLYGIRKLFESFIRAFQQIITPKERVKVERTKGKLILEYKTQNESVRIERKENSLFARLTLPDRIFIFNQTPNSKIFKLYHNSGTYTLEIKNGETRELVQGEVEVLKPLFHETLVIFKQKLSKFKDYVNFYIL
jgi:hypothetical protein